MYLKARSSDRSCFSYTPQTSPDWWTRTTYKSICTRTTHRCTASVIQRIQQVFIMPCRRSAWMRSNRLQLNAATVVMWCASSRRMHQVPAVPLRVGADNVTPVSSVETSAFIWMLMRPFHDDTHLPNCCKLFQHPASAVERPKVVASSCCCVARHQSCADKA